MKFIDLLARQLPRSWGMRRTLPIMCVLVLSLVACGDVETDGEPRDQIEWLELHASDYLEDGAWRRSEIEASRWRPEVPYACKRLAAYALPVGGWDLLPVLDAVSGPVYPGEEVSEMVEFATDIPESREEWLELGESVFWRMPMRRDGYLEWLVEEPELLDEVGVPRNEDGSLQGIVHFRDARGDEQVGATCGLCHGGNGVAGQATATLDLGLGRAIFNEAHGAPGDEFREWGAGRVDVTDDGVLDPLRVPNLWGVEDQSHLNTSGAVKIASPASLAIRFETQYIVGHSMEARPDRVLTWALAMYVLSLESPHSAPQTDLPGAAVFEGNCTSCHNPNKSYSGDLVDATTIVGGSAAAFSPLRGTGLLKVSSLIGIGEGGPYFHDGRHNTLNDVLSENHPYGAENDEVLMSEREREDLVEFLKTL